MSSFDEINCQRRALELCGLQGRNEGIAIMNKAAVVELPFLSSELSKAPVLRDLGDKLLIEMEWPEDGCSLYQLRFPNPRAVRRLADAYCSEWEVEGLEDTVCEVSDSPWIAELASRTPKEYLHKWAMKHFMVRIDGLGCIEVVSSGVIAE